MKTALTIQSSEPFELTQLYTEMKMIYSSLFFVCCNQLD